MLSLIVDRVEPILCSLQSKTAQVLLLHKIGSTVYNQRQHKCSCCTKWVLLCLQSKTAQVLLLHKIDSTLSTIKDSTGTLVT